MTMTRTEVDSITGTVRIVELTAEEEAARLAEAAAYEAVAAPIRAQAAADAAEKADAKQSAVVQYLVSHTNAEIRQYVSNAANLSDLKTIVGHLAVAVAVMARRDLR